MHRYFPQGNKLVVMTLHSSNQVFCKDSSTPEIHRVDLCPGAGLVSRELCFLPPHVPALCTHRSITSACPQLPSAEELHIQGQGDHDLYNLSSDKHFLQGDSRVASPLPLNLGCRSSRTVASSEPSARSISFGDSSLNMFCCLESFKKPR